MNITYSTGTYYAETEIYNRWFAHVDGEMVGELYVGIDTEIIMSVEVDVDHRGQGIARALYEAADAQLDNLKHAPSAACTPEGVAFAEAMGGEVAEDMDELATHHEMTVAL